MLLGLSGRVHGALPRWRRERGRPRSRGEPQRLRRRRARADEGLPHRGDARLRPRLTTTFVLNRRYTFAVGNGAVHHQACGYALVNALGFATNQADVELLVEQVHRCRGMTLKMILTRSVDRHR